MPRVVSQNGCGRGRGEVGPLFGPRTPWRSRVRRLWDWGLLLQVDVDHLAAHGRRLDPTDDPTSGAAGVGACSSHGAREPEELWTWAHRHSGPLGWTELAASSQLVDPVVACDATDRPLPSAS